MSQTVLLVEDERDARESLSRALERAGYRCLAAADYDAALTLARSTAGLALVITDVALGTPGRSGLELIVALRTAGVVAPIMVITAFADVDKVKFALNAGAAYLIEKPFRAAQLIDAMRHVLADPTDLGRRIEQVLAQVGLTDKELVVAKHLLKGLTSLEIAELESNSERTIRQHISRIYEKCGVSTRAELFHHVFPF